MVIYSCTEQHYDANSCGEGLHEYGLLKEVNVSQKPRTKGKGKGGVRA
jgi:hypothetical protein